VSILIKTSIYKTAKLYAVRI